MVCRVPHSVAISAFTYFILRRNVRRYVMSGYTSQHVMTGRRHGGTVDTSVCDGQELIIAARVAEEFGVDGKRASLAAAARLTERVLNVEVTVASERDPAACRAHSVVTSVSRPLEDEHHHSRICAAAAGGGGGCRVTRQIEDGVEAGVTALGRRQRQRRTDDNTTCTSHHTRHSTLTSLFEQSRTH